MRGSAGAGFAAEMHEQENSLGSAPQNQAAARRCSRVQLASCLALMVNPDDNTDLLEYVARSIEDDEEFHFLRFERLQRTNIVAQQVELFGLKQQFKNAQDVSANDLKHLKDTLKDYGMSRLEHS